MKLQNPDRSAQVSFFGKAPIRDMSTEQDESYTGFWNAAKPSKHIIYDSHVEYTTSLFFPFGLRWMIGRNRYNLVNYKVIINLCFKSNHLIYSLLSWVIYYGNLFTTQSPLAQIWPLARVNGMPKFCINNYVSPRKVHLKSTSLSP